MNFLKRFAEGFAFAAVIIVAFLIPATAIVLASGFVGAAYGPLAMFATYLVGICATVGTAVAIID